MITVRPVSPRCFDPFPKKTSPAEISGKDKPHSRTKREYPLTFVRMSEYEFMRTRSDLFIEANCGRREGWILPEVSLQLDTLHDRLLSHVTTTGGPFSNPVRRHGCHVAVFVAQTLSGESVAVEPSYGSLFSQRDHLRGVPVKPICCSQKSKVAKAGIIFDEHRLGIVQGRFMLPSGVPVIGPYLVAALVEYSTNLVVRARVWPIFLSPDGRSFNPVCSSLERLLHLEAYDQQMVSYSPTDKSEAAILQEYLAQRWVGDLSAYGFLPDAYFFPPVCLPVGIAELFAIKSMKKYNEGMKTKNEHGEEGQRNGLFKFLAIQANERNMTPQRAEVLCRETLCLYRETWKISGAEGGKAA